MSEPEPTPEREIWVPSFGMPKPREPVVFPGLPLLDGMGGLLYPGTTNERHGRWGSGKSWSAQIDAAAVLRAGNLVLYVDYEANEPAVKWRIISVLRGFGLMPPEVEECMQRFGYIRPEGNIITGDKPMAAFARLLKSYEGVGPEHLFITDGVPKALSAAGLSSRSEDDIARWDEQVLQQLIRLTGMTELHIDHTSRAGAEGAAHGAVGSQEKSGIVDGLSFKVECATPFNRTRAGRISFGLVKDRNGILEAVSGEVLCEWLITPRDGGEVIEVSVVPSEPGEDEQLNKDIYYSKICQTIADAGPDGFIGEAKLEDLAGGGRKRLAAALADLEGLGFIKVIKPGRPKPTQYFVTDKAAVGTDLGGAVIFE